MPDRELQTSRDDGRPIGIFDSGVGGLTVARSVLDELPCERVLYFGDTARVPYGGKSAETVQRYSGEIAHTLESMGVKCLVVACNTASALAIDALRGAFCLPVVGVVEPGADAAVAATKNRRIGVVGTRATMGSGAYERAILKRMPGAEIHSAPCPLFVPLVEEMWLASAVTRDVVGFYLDPLLGAGIDTLVLGCTHYPFLRDTIAAHCGPDVTIVDSATACASSLKDLLHEENLLAGRQSGEGPAGAEDRLEILLTDTPVRFLDLANTHLALGVSRDNVRLVPPESLAVPGQCP